MNKMHRFLSVFLVGHLMPLLPMVSAQYNGSFDRLFFDRAYSARSEALGRSGTSVLNGAFSLNTNSSLLGFSDNLSIAFSTSEPYYLDDEGRHLFMGLSTTLNDNYILGLSRAGYSSGIPQDYEIWVYGISLGYKFHSNVAMSIDARHVKEYYPKNLTEVKPDNDTWFYDTNISVQYPYSKFFLQDADVTIGLAIRNIFGAKVNYRERIYEVDLITGNITPRVLKYDVPLPRLISAGFSHSFNIMSLNENSKFGDITLMLVGEYLNVMDYKHNTALLAGVELGISSWVWIRAGRYNQSKDDHGFENNKKYVSGYTRGIGVQIPLSLFGKKMDTSYISIDYTRLQHNLFTDENVFNIGKFTTLSTSLNIGI